MMTSTMIVALAALAATAIAAFTGLTAWREWLGYRRLMLTSAPRPGAAPMAERIEVADLRERVRKLEAIASCVDL